MDTIYYIYGSKEDPESIKRALYDVCPNVENPSGLTFETECGIYFILNNKIRYSSCSNAGTDVIKMFGIELQPKKQEKFVEKTMYQRISKDEYEACYGSNIYFYTIEDAMCTDDAIGYKEVKIMIKE